MLYMQVLGTITKGMSVACLPVLLPGSCSTHHLTMDQPIARPGELVSRDAGVRMARLRVGGYLDLRPLGFTFGGCGNSESPGFFSFK